MAKYRLHSDRYINGVLYLTQNPLQPKPEVDLPDDFPAGRDMEPLDDAARRQVAKYNADIHKRNEGGATVQYQQPKEVAYHNGRSAETHRLFDTGGAPHDEPPKVPSKPKTEPAPAPHRA